MRSVSVDVFTEYLCHFRISEPHVDCTIFYRDVMVYVPGGCLLLSLVVLLTLLPQKVGDRSQRGNSDLYMIFIYGLNNSRWLSSTIDSR